MMKEVKISSRDSRFELLRIISMFLIVLSHFGAHGKFDLFSNNISINKLWLQLICMGGTIGDNLFVLISGYFLIDISSIKISRIIKLWLQIFTYSALIYLMSIFVGTRQFDIIELIKNLMPITFERWWFPSTYFIMYLLSPLLNKMLKSIDKKSFRRYLMLLFLLWSIMPMVTNQYMQSNGLLWFVFLYSCAAYIRLYGLKYKENKCIVFSILCFVVTYSTVIVLDILGLYVNNVSKHSMYFYDKQYPFVFLTSVGIFVCFYNIKKIYSRKINSIASTTFGIYLISDNYIVNPILWHRLFKNSMWQDSSFLIIYTFFVVCTVFCICSIIELIRKKVEIIYMKKVYLLDNINYDWR